MQWLPFVGQGAHGGELVRWQQLFFAFRMRLASTNAFAQGGGVRLQLLLGHARRWANGERPDRVGFRVETKWEEKECSHYIPVAELFGFLNLDRYPYYNGVSGETYAGFVKSPDASAYDRCEAVGAWTAPFLAEHPEAERDLAAWFRARVEEAAQPPWLWMEGILGPKSLKQAAETQKRVDAALQAALGGLAAAKAREWTDWQAAAALVCGKPQPVTHARGTATRGAAASARRTTERAVREKGVDMSLVFVHGRGQGAFSATEVKERWVKALLAGAKLAQITFDDGVLRGQIRLPYYASELDRLTKSKKSHMGQSEDLRGTDVEAEFLQEVAEKISFAKADTAMRANDALRGVEARSDEMERGFTNSRFVIALARFLDSHASPELLDLVVRDVGTYLQVAEARRVVNGIVEASIAEATEPRIIVAHSLGSVVALDVLMGAGTKYPVRHLITLGSPLAVRAVLTRLRADDVFSWPECIAAWTNAADRRDIVALEPSLDRLSLFRSAFNAKPRVGRFDIHNLTDIVNPTPNRHSIEGYLGDPLVAQTILAAAGIATEE